MSDLMGSPKKGLSAAPQRTPNPSSQGDLKTLPSHVNVTALAVDSFQHLWGCGEGGVVRWMITPTQTTYKIWHQEHGLAGNDAVALIALKDRVFVGHSSGQISVYTSNTWSVNPHTSRYPIHSFGLINDRLLACSDDGLLDVDTGDLWSTPYPALCVVMWQKQIWLGTTYGIWTWQNDHWVLANSEITASTPRLSPIGTHLYLVGSSLKRMSAEKAVSKAMTASPVAAVVLYNQELVIVGPQGGKYLGSGKRIEAIPGLDAPSQDLIQYHDGIVFACEKQVILFTKDNMRDLFPLHESPLDAVRRFTTQHIEWVQDSNGHIWCYTNDTWELILATPHTMMTGATLFQHNILISFNGVKGLGLLKNGRLVLQTSLSFVLGLASTHDRVWAASVDALYHSSDAQNWTKINYPAALKSVQNIWVDSGVVYIEDAHKRYSVQNAQTLIEVSADTL